MNHSIYNDDEFMNANIIQNEYFTTSASNDQELDNLLFNRNSSSSSSSIKGINYYYPGINNNDVMDWSQYFEEPWHHQEEEDELNHDKRIKNHWNAASAITMSSNSNNVSYDFGEEEGGHPKLKRARTEPSSME